MPVAAPPFGAIRNLEAVEPLRRKDRAIGGGADELRRLGAEHEFADLGSDAVGADDDIGLCRRAVVKDQADRTACFLQVDQLMIERDRSGSDAAFQHRVQVAAVDIDIGTAIAPLALGVEHELIHRLAGVPGAADVALRFDAGFDQCVLDAETAEHLRHVGAEDDARADPRERRCLLIDFHCKAGALQEAGGAQAAETGADDRNAFFLIALGSGHFVHVPWQNCRRLLSTDGILAACQAHARIASGCAKPRTCRGIDPGNEFL